MSKKILYIGNDLTQRSGYMNTMQTLSNLLRTESYTVVTSSKNKFKFLRLIAMCFAILKYRNKVDYVLIDTFSTISFYFAFVTSQLARLFGLKYIPILHGGNLPARLDSSPKLAGLIFKNAYKNVAPSGYLKYEFEKRGFLTQFIPNILELDSYNYITNRKLNYKILYVRAFVQLYNPTMAIRVLKNVQKKYPQTTLCMVGPHKDASYIETVSLVKELNLNKSVEFTGTLPKEKWHKLSENFDVFINTTNFDNTPVSVMEAMALGIPIVSTNVGGVPYLIDNAKDGILVDKNDDIAMTNAIIDLFENSTKRQKITQCAREKVEAFDWQTVKKDWINILN
uniref:glycosyltransferase family 4 protein n=1 Tax=Flavicella sediminum TaxID=2585141 RepID=UPI003742FAB0